MFPDEAGDSHDDVASNRTSSGPPIDALAGALREYCPPELLVALMQADVDALLRAVVLSLGETGRSAQVPPLAALLHHESLDIAQLAENSLWRVWMRSGSKRGSRDLADAVQQIKLDRLEDALFILEDLCRREPNFAEAHHQRGLVLLLLERFDPAITALRAALKADPWHFTAAVNLGHTLMQRGDFRQALEHYRSALELNPRLAGISELIDRLEALVGGGTLAH